MICFQTGKWSLSPIYLKLWIFTGGQFWPPGIDVVVVGLRVLLLLYVCVCVINHELVCVETHHPLKLVSPHLDQSCKTNWLKLLLFLTLTSKVKLNFKSKSTPFLVNPCDKLPPLEAITSKLGQKMQNTLLKIPIVLRIALHDHVNLKFQISWIPGLSNRENA